jgi:PAS domain-containing protein
MALSTWTAVPAFERGVLPDRRLAPVRFAELDFQSITHEDDLDADLNLLRQLNDGAIDRYQLDKRYLHADGRIIWVHLAVSMVRNPDGSPKHYIAQVQTRPSSARPNSR